MADTPDKPVKKPVGSLAAFQNRDFTLFWFSALVSNSTQWMQQIIVPIIVFDLTRSNTWVGLVFFCQTMPALILTPLAGIIADRIERVKVLRYTVSIQCIVALLFLTLWEFDQLAPTVIALLSLIQGVSAGLQIANWQSMVPLLVQPNHLFSAIKLNSTQFIAARAFGPIMGIVLLSFLGESAVFSANAVTYILLFIALMIIQPVQELPAVPTKVWLAFKQGFQYVKERKSIIQAIVTGFTISLLGQSLTSLAAGLVEDHFNGNDTDVFWFVIANGSGSIVSSTLLIRYADRFSVSTVIKTGLVFYTFGPVLIGITGIYFLGIAGYAICGIAHMMVAVSVNTSIQGQLPDQFRGRVLSIYLMGVFGGISLGALIGGRLGDVFGIEKIFVAYGIGIAIYFLMTILVYKGLKLLNVEMEDAN